MTLLFSSRTLISIAQSFKAVNRDIAITDSSRPTISSSKQKEADSTNGVRAGAERVRSTKTPQGADMSSKVSSKVSSKTTSNYLQMYIQTPGEETFETFNRKEKAVLTSNRDVRYDVHLSIKSY